jgi:DNA-binding CsgD family transcriptional regulator/PAS domain-containing protein
VIWWRGAGMPSNKHKGVSEESFLDVVSRVYDAGLDASLWPDTLSAISDLFGAEQINLRIIDPSSRRLERYYAINRDPYWVQAYKDHFYQLDPWMDMLHDSDKPIVDCTHHLLTDRKYRSLPFYQEYIVPTDAHYGMGGLIRVHDDFKTYLAMQKGYGRGEFHVSNLRLFEKLFPHVNRSLAVSHRIQHAENRSDTLMQALDRISNAVVLVNRAGRVLSMNEAAGKLVDRHCGISVTGGHIQLSGVGFNLRLHRLIDAATASHNSVDGAQAGGMDFEYPGHSNLSLLVSPLSGRGSGHEFADKRVAMLILSDRDESNRLEGTLLVDIYGLSEAEARVVSLLCAGKSLEQIGERLSLTRNTIRSHVKSAFHKTGTSRQAELVSLINCGPVGLVKRL